MVLTVIRGIFVLLVAVVSSFFVLEAQKKAEQLDFSTVVLIIMLALGAAALIVAGDVFSPSKRLSSMSGVILGLMAGLVVAVALSFVVDLMAVLTVPDVTEPEPSAELRQLANQDYMQARNLGLLPGRGLRPIESGAAAQSNDFDASATQPGLPATGETGINPAVTLAQPDTAPATQPRILAPTDQFVARLRRKINEYDQQVRARQAYLNLLQGVKVFIGLITCYLGISLVLQTRGDFRFVIPYIEFAREIRGTRPTLLDTSVIIDGRILDVVQTRIIQMGLVVPKFVLQELQTVADSADRLKRARGRRGLDVLQKLQENPAVQVSIHDEDAEGATVDQKLVALAQQMNARIMTNDFNLNKIATLRGVTVINLNDVAAAMRPVVLPGETLTTKVLKYGEGPSQGVGYLADGTMVVVENGRMFMGQEVSVTVTSMLQTAAGRMIFGRAADEHRPSAQPVAGGSPADQGASAGGGDRANGPGATATPPMKDDRPADDYPPRPQRGGPFGRNPRNPRR